jgi:hypothetical protein
VYQRTVSSATAIQQAGIINGGFTSPGLKDSRILETAMQVMDAFIKRIEAVGGSVKFESATGGLR